MPVLRETVHHASGTFVAGTELAASHPLVLAGPHLFDDVATVDAPVKRGPGRARKSED